MEEEEISNRGLVLRLGRGEFVSEGRRSDGQRKRPVEFHVLFPTHTMKEEMVIKEEPDVDRLSCKTTDEEGEDANTSSNSKTSARKKLKLTKEQSTLLDESFKQHSTLNPIQKQELAKKLNLKPRQVEVWFQNRRARTKLKQTEVDCEFLRMCCESLSDENRRLKNEVQELRSIKLGLPVYVQLPKATRPLTMCPSCEMTATSNSTDTWFDVAKANKSHTPIRNESY